MFPPTALLTISNNRIMVLLSWWAGLCNTYHAWCAVERVDAATVAYSAIKNFAKSSLWSGDVKQETKETGRRTGETSPLDFPPSFPFVGQQTTKTKWPRLFMLKAITLYRNNEW